jgi:hypothetical protein
MEYPTCSVCDKPLSDWEGNVMVSLNDFIAKPRKISDVRVICKPSTRNLPSHLDPHNIWELAWIRDNTVYILGSIILDLSGSNPTQWEEASLNEVYGLCTLAHPEMSRGVLEF